MRSKTRPTPANKLSTSDTRHHRPPPASARPGTMSAEAAPTKTDAPAETAAAAPATSAAAPATPATPIQELWAAAQAAGHGEIWGVTLADPATHVPSQIVLQKYLNANDGDVARAREQLTKTLAWRAETQPLELLARAFARSKFEGVGYVTDYAAPDADVAAEPDRREVFTWNVYGAVKNMDETFGVLDE